MDWSCSDVHSHNVRIRGRYNSILTLIIKFAAVLYANPISHAHIQGKTVDQEMDRMRFIVPKRIAVRYAQHFKLPRLDLYRYDMTSSITKAKVCTAEFKIRWAYMRARLSDDELFSLFKDSGFSPRDHEVTGIAFVRAVLQRYKDVKVFC